MYRLTFTHRQIHTYIHLYTLVHTYMKPNIPQQHTYNTLIPTYTHTYVVHTYIHTIPCVYIHTTNANQSPFMSWVVVQ